jgi:pimeloyl-ACP methyl ester carboxylesterase
VPVKIWHGCQDRFVPVQHGQWLAASVPGAEADISDHDGHLTLIGRIGEIHDWLLQYF